MLELPPGALGEHRYRRHLRHHRRGRLRCGHSVRTVAEAVALAEHAGKLLVATGSCLGGAERLERDEAGEADAEVPDPEAPTAA
jgi:hypothetical protein